MNLKKLISREIIITMVSVILISITFFSVSYAIYMTVDEREIGTLSFADLYFESCTNSDCENVGEDLGNSIINISAVPMSDTEGLALDPYSFRVSNSGNLQLVTYIYISIDTSTAYDFSDLKVAYKESTDSDYTITSYGENEIFLLATVTLEPSDSKIFDVLMWASEAMGNDLIGGNFNAYVNAVAYYYPEDEDNLHTVVPNGTNTIANAQFITQFSYTGSYQTYTVPATGWYNVELWGAQGGDATYGGKGGYTSGLTYLNQGDNYYIYVGSQGSGATGGYNGGGLGTAAPYPGLPGGGATDIRLVSGTWNNSTSLNSRVMVAAGGGGGQTYFATHYGGTGGGLYGSSGTMSGTAATAASGGTQISGGPQTDGFATRYAGVFGVGGYNTSGTGGGGGSGYYGGAAGPHGSGTAGSGAGGSSFISGYAGVNAITSASSTTHTNNTLHYSGKYFINGKMLAGVNSGNGKAKITFIGVSKPGRIDTKLDNVRYVKNCINGSSYSATNNWVEIQAIYNGSNVAYGKTVTGTAAANASYPYSNLTDGNIASDAPYGQTDSTGLQCVTVDLGQSYNLDEIALWRRWGIPRTYNSDTTSVSSDNSTWTEVINEYSPDTNEGKRSSAYEEYYNGYVGPNLALYYDGNTNVGSAHNASATTWKNLVGGTLNGTLNGTPVWGSNYLTFDGVDDWVGIALMNYANPTVEVVAEVTTAPGAGLTSTLFANYETGGYGLAFDSYYRTRGTFYISEESAYEMTYSPIKYYLNRKYHFATSYNGTNIKMFTNGKDIYTVAVAGTIGTPVAGAIGVVGANPNSAGGVSGEYFTGKIYSVRVYDRALTAAEIKHNYEFDKLYYGLN